MATIADWTPDLERHGKPHYRAIADAIAQDVRDGRLHVSDRLPPQRELADRLGINFTTVARGYVEAQKRGLIESRVGQGTFVIGQPRRPRAAARPAIVDLTMNVAPEPEDRSLYDRMQSGMLKVGNDLPTLLRYQAFGGTYQQREVATRFLRLRGVDVDPERLQICPGTHVAFQSILQVLTSPGDTLLCEALTYPGIKAIAGRLGLALVGIPLDDEGIDPAAFEELCREHRPKALYLNPTLLNPTTSTMPEARRLATIAVARAHDVTIIEDDAYGALLRRPIPAFATLAPDITYYVASLSKCVGAGLRIAYVVAPDQRRMWPISALMRTTTVMASPLTTALSTLWIEDGTAVAIVEALRKEIAARQKLVTELLPAGSYVTHPEAFHLWMALPQPWQRSAFAARMRSSDISIVVSDAFTVGSQPVEAVRVSLGGVLSRAEVSSALDFLSHVLEHETETGPGFA
ncbi:DNA-binding transcriptional regulator, MocR family, contains an aminotransferase domain [Novosphingobium sp. CF614]|uniref:aminotransferase-like domain-containing protein n=1 Tax=Novosphingobium sp. CF614 TaxID=1884364 RepID=UPI0008E7B7E7|nr:PLP-dependent aminotransferase family protein [Novosphingobium sp. CF614]SFG37311.1 DNA-binding transcriptional regulator, MocR family, contains an aminotransferase domain [Novosphingobium sp. CF614]